MTSLSSREAQMLKVLHNVSLAGLKPLLWHLDREGLRAFGDVTAGSVDASVQKFMNVPIDPVARRGVDWTLDVTFGITITGRWPKLCTDVPSMVSLGSAARTIN